MIVTLRGKTSKGKNRVRENGARWRVLARVDAVRFSDERGPWLRLRPESRDDDGRDRWSHATHDRDFEVIP